MVVVEEEAAVVAEAEEEAAEEAAMAVVGGSGGGGARVVAAAVVVVVGVNLDHPLINLDCRHRRVCGEQLAGQRALARPQLDHAEAVVIAGSERAHRVVQPLDNPACDRRVGEEVLAEALLGLWPVAVPARRRGEAGRARQWQPGRC